MFKNISNAQWTWFSTYRERMGLKGFSDVHALMRKAGTVRYPGCGPWLTTLSNATNESRCVSISRPRK